MPPKQQPKLKTLTKHTLCLPFLAEFPQQPQNVTEIIQLFAQTFGGIGRRRRENTQERRRKKTEAREESMKIKESAPEAPSGTQISTKKRKLENTKIHRESNKKQKVEPLLLNKPTSMLEMLSAHVEPETQNESEFEALEQSITVGLSATTRLLAKPTQIQALILIKEKDPRNAAFYNHLYPQCHGLHVLMLDHEHLNTISHCLGMPRAGCVGLKYGFPQIEALIDIILKSTAEIQCSWLMLDAIKVHPVTVKTVITTCGPSKKQKRDLRKGRIANGTSKPQPQLAKNTNIPKTVSDKSVSQSKSSGFRQELCEDEWGLS